MHRGREGREERKIERKARGLRCADVMVALGLGFLHLNPGSRQVLLCRAISGGLRRNLGRGGNPGHSFPQLVQLQLLLKADVALLRLLPLAALDRFRRILDLHPGTNRRRRLQGALASRSGEARGKPPQQRHEFRSRARCLKMIGSERRAPGKLLGASRRVLPVEPVGTESDGSSYPPVQAAALSGLQTLLVGALADPPVQGITISIHAINVITGFGGKACRVMTTSQQS